MELTLHQLVIASLMTSLRDIIVAMINLKETDKQLHVLVCALIVVTLYPIIGWHSVTIALIIGLGKEVVWDYLLGRGEPCVKDMIANVIGSVLGVVLFYIQYILK